MNYKTLKFLEHYIFPDNISAVRMCVWYKTLKVPKHTLLSYCGTATDLFCEISSSIESCECHSYTRLEQYIYFFLNINYIFIIVLLFIIIVLILFIVQNVLF